MKRGDGIEASSEEAAEVSSRWKYDKGIEVIRVGGTLNVMSFYMSFCSKYLTAF